MNATKLITIVVAIILIQIVLIFFVFTSKQKEREDRVSNENTIPAKKNLLNLEPINLGEVVVPLPTIKEDEEVTVRVKIVIYIKELKDIEPKEFENKYKPRLREIAAKIIKGRSYAMLRNMVEEEEAIKILMRNTMNKEIGKDVVQEVVFDGTFVFE